MVAVLSPERVTFAHRLRLAVMVRKKIVITSIFAGLIVCLAAIFRPVPAASPENTLKSHGTVETVFETGENDLVFKLKGDDRIYYLNQGLENGLTLAELREDLSGQAIEIYYVKYWTPIDPLSKLKHIAKVDVNRTTLYSEIK